MLTFFTMSTSTGTFTASPQLAVRPASRPAAVRLDINFGMGVFGLSDAAKLPVVQSALNEIVAADGAMLEPDEAVLGEAEKMATLILKPKRTHDETTSLVPFIRDQFYSIHKIDTRVCNQEVHSPPHAHPPAQPAHPPRPHSDPASFPPFGRCGTSRTRGRCRQARSGGA